MDRAFCLRMLAGLFLAVLSAVMLTLAFPPYGLWPLIFLGLAPALVALHRVMPEKLAGLAFATGVGGFFYWYFRGAFAGTTPFMEWLPLFIATVAGLTAQRDVTFHRLTGYRWLIPHIAAVWVGIEMIRALIPFVGTWGFVAYALHGQPWLIQPVSVFGIFGLGMVIAAVNGALAQLALAWVDSVPALSGLRGRAAPVNRTLALRSAGAVGLVLGGWILLSLVLLEAAGPEIQVAALQPGGDISTTEAFEDLLDQTRQAAEGGAGIIVWPEGTLSFDPRQEHQEVFLDLAAETGAYLTVGYAVDTPEGLRNEATLVSPEGEFLGVFGKDHPVTFAGETSLTRGSYPAFETSLGPVGIIICYDLDFTDTARKVTQSGARFIAVPSRDWPAIAEKHYTHLVFRAVENRVSMAKADTAYNSAIVDPWGRVVESAVSTRPERTTVMASVPLGTDPAPLVRLGDWTGWLALMGLLLFLGADIVLRVRRSPSAPDITRRGR